MFAIEEEECMECGNLKLANRDCQTPHCKGLREEASEFYDSVTEDSITINGATMYAGIDY